MCYFIQSYIEFWNIGIDDPTDRKNLSKIDMKMARPTISSITMYEDIEKFRKIKFRTDKLMTK